MPVHACLFTLPLLAVVFVKFVCAVCPAVLLLCCVALLCICMAPVPAAVWRRLGGRVEDDVV